MNEQIVDWLLHPHARGLAPGLRLADVTRAALSYAARVLGFGAKVEGTRSVLSELQAEGDAIMINMRSAKLSEVSEAIALVHRSRADLTTLLRATGTASDVTGNGLVIVTRRHSPVLPTADSVSADQKL